MAIRQRPIVTDMHGRQFACFPLAILIFIVNETERILFLSHPEQKAEWQIVKGGLEAGETILEAALRETREEVGADVQVRPLGTVHAVSVRHDDNVQHVVSLLYLMAYEGGQVQPGDDMLGSQFRWWSLEELAAEGAQVTVQSEEWIMKHAIELYRLWKGQEIDLECAKRDRK
jgi:ADP-ribose pyrophosphatase YjhB (NUDIX family)